MIAPFRSDVSGILVNSSPNRCAQTASSTRHACRIPLEVLTRTLTVAEDPKLVKGLTVCSLRSSLSRSFQLHRPAGVLKPLVLSQMSAPIVLFLSSLSPFVWVGINPVLYLLAG